MIDLITLIVHGLEGIRLLHNKTIFHEAKLLMVS